MKKVTSREDLQALRSKYRDHVLMRLLSYDSLNRREILVGMADCGIAAGAKDVLKTLFDESNIAKLEDVSVIATDCMGSCGDEPMVKVVVPGKEPVVYKKVDTAMAKEIITKHLVGGTALAHGKTEV